MGCHGAEAWKPLQLALENLMDCPALPSPAQPRGGRGRPIHLIHSH